MLLYLTFTLLQAAFVLGVGAWITMLLFLAKHPAPADWPRDPFARWSRFMRGDGFADAAQPRRRLIAWGFRLALACMALSILCFFLAGGPGALPPPPPR